MSSSSWCYLADVLIEADPPTVFRVPGGLSPTRTLHLFWGNYWHGPPPKPPEGVVVNTGGVPWRFGRLVSI